MDPKATIKKNIKRYMRSRSLDEDGKKKFTITFELIEYSMYRSTEKDALVKNVNIPQLNKRIHRSSQGLQKKRRRKSSKKSRRGSRRGKKAVAAGVY